MKNVKYWAGLFDSDGSFDIDPTKRENGSYYINARATLYQKNPAPLELLAAEYGVEIKPSKNCFCVSLRGKNARMFIQEIKQHLVIKRNVAEFVLSVAQTTVADIKALRQEVKNARATRTSEKDFPSRRWMAGYIDGDGCIHSSYRKRDGNLEFKLAVVSHESQNAGLLLMQKAFGGIITEQRDVRKWSVTLSVTKGKQVLEFFTQHLLMKKQQADLVLDCLRTGKHLLRKGATPEGNLRIHKTLQQLKLLATTK
jgi:hypothetical protein